jgi:hypothetical protein
MWVPFWTLVPFTTAVLEYASYRKPPVLATTPTAAQRPPAQPGRGAKGPDLPLSEHSV